MKGPGVGLYIACKRRDLKWILPEIRKIDPNAFYVIDQATGMSKSLGPFSTPRGGWRFRNKRK